MSRLAVLWHYLAARRRWLTLRGAALERFQERRASEAAHYSARHSAFYREHWAGHDVGDWRALPPVDKSLMMANFGAFNTRGVGREAAMKAALEAERERGALPSIEGLTVGLSSGTSGHRGLFLVSPAEEAMWAGTALARVLPSLRPGTRIAFFLRSNSRLYEAGSGVVRFRYFDLQAPLADAVAGLNAFLPDLVVGPPSLLGMLADEREVGRLRARPGGLVSVAEVLEPQDRARLEGVFGVPLGEVYQCTEGLLAVRCPAGSLHVQEDAVALEFEPLPGEGERVNPVVTDLWRRVQPIVRYRLGDVLTLSKGSCPCGSDWRVIAAVEGRQDDLCRFEAVGGGLRPFFPDTVRRMVLLAAEGIADYQAVQARPGELTVRLEPVPGADFDALRVAVARSVTETVLTLGCRPPTVSVELGLESVAPGAKRRRVVCAAPIG